MFFLELLRSIFFFRGSYSNDVFLEPLSLEEEEKCIEGKMRGDKASRDKLIEHNLRLVAHIAKRFEKKDISQDDLPGKIKSLRNVPFLNNCNI